jgi:hypothetical protein
MSDGMASGRSECGAVTSASFVLGGRPPDLQDLCLTGPEVAGCHSGDEAPGVRPLGPSTVLDEPPRVSDCTDRLIEGQSRRMADADRADVQKAVSNPSQL